MSKAFTKEDDDAGVSLPGASSFVVPSGPFHITTLGAARLSKMPDQRIVDVLLRAEILPATAASPERATLGVTVYVENDGGHKKSYRLVTSEERGLLGEGCSVHSPLGSALLGKEAGDVCEVITPRG
ncbi:MAG: GreA/GreB family elongation factor, partial [Polyangiaceae bacterium]